MLGVRHFLILLLAQVSIPATAISTVTITSANPATTTTSPSYTNDDSFRTSCLNSTNTFRRQHNATTLTWNTTLAITASSLATRCEFEHSGGPAGENIAAGYQNVTAAIDGWGNERAKYNFGKGGFGENTGHFTQLVWKATSTVGCARKECEKIGWFVVCEYWPPGNVQGAYKEQVQKQNGKRNEAHVLGRRSLRDIVGTVVLVIFSMGRMGYI
ncbi:MAG: hypothetical protein Q9218_004034 [Villophora microphyllina]